MPRPRLFDDVPLRDDITRNRSAYLIEIDNLDPLTTMPRWPRNTLMAP